MGDDPCILNWLKSVVAAPCDSESAPPSSSERPRKRAKPNHSPPKPNVDISRSERIPITTSRSRLGLPTPAVSTSSRTPSSTSSASHLNSDPSSQLKGARLGFGMASKRTRDQTAHDDTIWGHSQCQQQRCDADPTETNDPDPSSQNDLTPRPPRQLPAAAAFNSATPGPQTPSVASSSRLSSQASSKVSKISRNSSPTKQIRNAELQETGFFRATFEDEELPQPLENLTQDLRRINDGYAILPKRLQEDLSNERIQPWMFTDEPLFGISHLPDVRVARKIFRLAKRCFLENLAESSWNNDVHSQILEWALRDSPDSDDLLDYRYCLTAQIVKPWQPVNAPSKMVDFCICIQPETNSPQYEAIRSLCRYRPGMSINHTDWGDLTKYPIAVSIETKGPEESYDTALLQVATWHSSQWRSLRRDGERTADLSKIQSLLGIIVIKHDWYLVATVRDSQAKARTIERLPLGSTEAMLGIYKLSIALQRILQWARLDYWPAFQAEMLGLE